MHTKDPMVRSSALGGLAGSLLLFLLTAALGGCPERDARDVNRRTVEKCQQETCACVFNDECPGELQCVNGACVAGGGVDVIDDVVEDTSPADTVVGDTGVPVDTTGDTEGDTAQDTTDTSQDIGATGTAGFGEFCEHNTDCASGWCVDSPSGGYCSHTCLEGCPSDWVCKTVSGFIDPIELCAQDENRLCGACEVDDQCGAAGSNRCLDIGGGRFCGRDCETSPCPSGYDCTELELDGVSTQQCVPANGTCDCTPVNAGLVKTCTATNAFGTCVGSAVCDPDQGFVDCTARTPGEEICNGVDDDCDGQTDEGQAPTACERSNDFGTCTGTETCQGSAGRVCTALEPSAEACNGADDDCDSETDEDFVDEDGVYYTVEHCGACGQSCAEKFDHAAEVACDLSGESPACKLVSCEPGYILFNDATCISENATLCNPCGDDDECFGEGSRCLSPSPTDPRTFCGRDCSGGSGFTTECPASYACVDDGGGPAQCLPVTGSCDCTEANAGQVKACARQNDVGTCFGQETCDPATGWGNCSAPEPSEEVCNGVDDDCDGFLDEDQEVGAACDNANDFGTCTGVTLCAGSAGIVCTAATPAAEVCDGIDNDCDGETDEGFATLVGGALKYGVSAEHCGACNYACPAVDHGEVACDPVPAVPRCTVIACEEGYYPHLGAACLAVPSANQCAPCSGASDCQGPGDLCVDEASAETAFCARDCAAGAIYDTAAAPCTGTLGEQGCCPDGATCQDGGNGARVCRPDSGSCRCVEDGAVTTCTDDNGFGTCVGTQVCELDGPSPGLSACTAPTPTAEVCDGSDNDCDGLYDAADDSLDLSTTPTGNAACDNGPGCVGSWSCVAGGWQCSAATPSDEICDGHDNDCDGVVDNGFRDAASGLYLSVDHCGGCGLDCDAIVAQNAGTTCGLLGGAPTCLATACADGFYPFDGGRACLALPDNLCQACSVDADCLVPSSRCVDTGSESFCARSCAGDSPYGTGCPTGYTCAAGPGGTSLCQPEGGSCQCGPDTVGVARACPVGACTGLQTCEADGGAYAFTDCSAVGLIPEVCDGADNDCNGQTDEGFLVGGVYPTDENCGVCGNNCLLRWSAAVDHAVGACSGGASPACVITSCTTEQEGGQTYEWVNVNGLSGDGCECRRLQGNTGSDLPDVDFGGVPTPQTVYADANCDGVDGVIGDALFVSAGNPQAGDGSLVNPYRTIGQALSAFAGSGKDYILVAGGDYEENLQLTAGVALHGGYAPDFRSRNIVTFPTRIVGQEPDFLGSSVVPGAVYASGITTATIVSGFVIRGYDVGTRPIAASATGFNSYGLYLHDCDDSLVIANCEIVGGVGGDGASGAPGGNGFGAASPGGDALTGGDGQNVEQSAGNCTATGACPGGAQRAGGAAGTNPQCSGANGIAGGAATCPTYEEASWTPPVPGKDGAPGYAWTRDVGTTAGTCNGHLTEAGFPDEIKQLQGYSGAAGGDGDLGLQGAGCADSDGAWVAGDWTNAPGATGQAGDPGARGGAGAPSGGVATAPAEDMPADVGAATDVAYKLGASGGGAGAGGCGGTGGTGGGSGGASIAVLVAFSGPSAVTAPPTIRDCVVARSKGGDGGIGGYGGSGGAGGPGGRGGDSRNFWVGFRAGDGGRGGFGGEGGGGGGGCGGASFGVAVYGGQAGWSNQVTATVAFEGPPGSTGGQGGAAGPSGQASGAAAGVSGASANVHAE